MIAFNEVIIKLYILQILGDIGIKLYEICRIINFFEGIAFTNRLFFLYN